MYRLPRDLIPCLLVYFTPEEMAILTQTLYPDLHENPRLWFAKSTEIIHSENFYSTSLLPSQRYYELRTYYGNIQEDGERYLDPVYCCIRRAHLNKPYVYDPRWKSLIRMSMGYWSGVTREDPAFQLGHTIRRIVRKEGVTTNDCRPRKPYALYLIFSAIIQHTPDRFTALLSWFHKTSWLVGILLYIQALHHERIAIAQLIASCHTELQRFVIDPRKSGKENARPILERLKTHIDKLEMPVFLDSPLHKSTRICILAPM